MPKLTLTPLTAVNDSAGVIARIPWELAARSVAPAPWTSYVAFTDDGQAAGACLFKDAPKAHPEVEIAYLTFPEWQNRGYGTAMACALLEIAAGSGAVDHVVAQTLPGENASVHICRRLHFSFAGEFIDPEDGKIWRWRKSIQHPAAAAGSLSAAHSPALPRASGGPVWA